MRKILRISIIVAFVICTVILILINNYVRKDIVSEYGEDSYKDELELDFESRFNLYNLTDEEKSKIVDWEVNGAHELIRLMCLKNGDWSKLPISKETREQFNEKDGILKGYDFESAEVDYEGVEYYDASPAKIIITNGKEKKRVYVDYRFTDEGINYINIEDIITIVDDNGNKLNEGFPFDDKHTIMNFETWVNVGLTDKYISNHGKELLDLFTHYSPLDYNPIIFDKSKSKLNNHMAYFIVTSVLECKEREYEVYYQLDENDYLDDAYAVCVKEKELEPTNKYLGAKIYYKNSNWNELLLTERFKTKFDSSRGTFQDIDSVIDGEIAIEKIDKNNYIFEFLSKDNKHIFYLYKNEYVNNYLDDVAYKKLPYENMSIEEVKEQYLKDLESKK